MKMAPLQEATNMKIIEEFGIPDKQVGTIAPTSLSNAECSGGKDTESNEDDALPDEGQIIDQEEEVCFSCPEEDVLKSM